MTAEELRINFYGEGDARSFEYRSFEYDELYLMREYANQQTSELRQQSELKDKLIEKYAELNKCLDNRIQNMAQAFYLSIDSVNSSEYLKESSVIDKLLTEITELTKQIKV